MECYPPTDMELQSLTHMEPELVTCIPHLLIGVSSNKRVPRAMDPDEKVTLGTRVDGWDIGGDG